MINYMFSHSLCFSETYQVTIYAVVRPLFKVVRRLDH